MNEIYVISTILIFLSTVFGYINVRFLKLPNTIGLMILTILFTLIVILLSNIDPTLLNLQKSIISKIDFKRLLLDEMLSFLLFAGALHTNFEQLKIQRWPIILFATLGVLISTILIGVTMFFALQLIGLEIRFVYCVLFGALISPTDPIAVLGILKKAGVPKKLETKIVGESLFNDGVSVVIFLTVFEMATSGIQNVKAINVAQLFGQEVIGGISLGLFLGWITYKLLKSIDDFDIEIIITLATVMGGTILCHEFHLSAPLAMVTAGLIVGNNTVKNTVKENSISQTTEKYVDKFWELIDILLNAILFVLIGMEMLVLVLEDKYIIAGLIAIPVCLLSRYVSLFLPIKIFEKKLNFVKKTNLIMTWGGLRGGVSIALALGLSQSMERDLFLVITYIVVVFSIVIQGLSLDKLVKKLD